VRHQDETHLMAILDSQIFGPAEKLRAELNPRALS
jgi:hypothetical protein